jgi:hypothetical protein
MKRWDEQTKMTTRPNVTWDSPFVKTNEISLNYEYYCLHRDRLSKTILNIRQCLSFLFLIFILTSFGENDKKIYTYGASTRTTHKRKEWWGTTAFLRFFFQLGIWLHTLFKTEWCILGSFRKRDGCLQTQPKCWLRILWTKTFRTFQKFFENEAIKDYRV